jgi:hypothetical protein
MQFLVGALTVTAFFCAFISGYMAGQRAKQPAVEFELDEDEAELQEQRERAKRLKKGFDEMMAYNEAKARKG